MLMPFGSDPVAVAWGGAGVPSAGARGGAGIRIFDLRLGNSDNRS